MPLEETVTTVRICVRKNTLAIHQVRTVANVKEDKACRTKLAVQADAENYNFNKFVWHWITV